jgi:hypothetical protein
MDEYDAHKEDSERELDNHQADPRCSSGRAPRILTAIMDDTFRDLADHFRPRIAKHGVVEGLAVKSRRFVIGSRERGTRTRFR